MSFILKYHNALARKLNFSRRDFRCRIVGRKPADETVKIAVTTVPQEFPFHFADFTPGIPTSHRVPYRKLRRVDLLLIDLARAIDAGIDPADKTRKGYWMAHDGRRSTGGRDRRRSTGGRITCYHRQKQNRDQSTHNLLLAAATPGPNRSSTSFNLQKAGRTLPRTPTQCYRIQLSSMKPMAGQRVIVHSGNAFCEAATPASVTGVAPR